MCALCGVLGGEAHWSEASSPSAADDPAARRRERAARIAAANRILDRFGMRLSDWQGGACVLATATGKSEVIAGFAHLWTAAETLSGRRFDPLEPAFLARLRDD